MATHLRYGIVGCGSMGREHIENIQAMPLTDGGGVAKVVPTRGFEPRTY